MTIETFDATDNWTAPFTGDVFVECWGAGANGSGGTGGGGGAYAADTVAVTSGTSYYVNVALGNGIGPTAFNVGAVEAKSASVAMGGSGEYSTGSVKYSGGNGGLPNYMTYGGGGGGGAGGSSGAGSNGSSGASGGAGGAAGTGGGTGGSAPAGTGNGNPGSAPGGGGSGQSGMMFMMIGGTGANGRVRLTYDAGGGGGGGSSAASVQSVRSNQTIL